MIALVTAQKLNKPDQEIESLLATLRQQEKDARIVAWDDPAVDWSDFDRILLRSPWDYYQRLDEFLDWNTAVAASARVDNPREVVEWNSHKSYLADLAAAGVATIPTVFVGGHDPDPLAAFGTQEVVLKPAVSVGAIGALRAPAHSAEARAHLQQLLEQGEVLLQPLVPSVSDEGEVSLIYFDNEYSHAVRKRPKSGDYRVQDHHGGSVEVHTAGTAEREVAQAALSAAPLPPLYARVDLVYWQEEPVVIELELIEPELFFRTCPESLNRLARLL